MLEVVSFIGLLASNYSARGVEGFFIFIWALNAIIFGHVAHGQIKRGQGSVTGGGLATTGLVLGYIALAPIALVLILGIVALTFFLTVRR
jgi:hypothetical protein